MHGLFAQLLKSVENVLTAAEMEDVRQYVDEGEWGLALHVFVFTVVAEARHISPSACDLFARLATLMDFDAYVEDFAFDDLTAAVELLRDYCRERERVGDEPLARDQPPKIE